MPTRQPLLCSILLSSFAGCFSVNGDPLELELDRRGPTPMAAIAVRNLTDAPARTEICADFRIERAQDLALLSSTGNPETIAKTVTQARADGAICGAMGAAGEAVVFRGLCDPTTTNAVRLSLEGIYVDGERLETSDLTCGVGCRRTFYCDADGSLETPDTDFTFDLDVFHDAHLGFVDLSLASLFPPGATGACFDVRATNARGTATWYAGNPTVHDARAVGSLCASAVGDGPRAPSALIPCDTRAPDYTITVWVKDLTFDAAVPKSERQWASPCAVASRGIRPGSWDGGCDFRVRCAEGESIPLDIAIDLQTGARTPGP